MLEFTLGVFLSRSYAKVLSFIRILESRGGIRHSSKRQTLSVRRPRPYLTFTFDPYHDSIR